MGNFKVEPKKADESLTTWQNRLAEIYHLDGIMQEIICVVSRVSYCKGIDDIIENMKKEGRL